MQITDTFRVDVPVEQAWKVLLDVERIAPCMPGAQLQEIEGDEYRGIVKIKVGPITAQYKGVARILEADEAARRIVLKGEGRDTRGQGNASATVTALLAESGGGTDVSIDTDLQVTGKVAQFGRGVMADVSAKLLGQFVECLHSSVLAGDPDERAPEGGGEGGDEPESPPAPDPTPGTGATDLGTGGVRTIDAPEAQAVDLTKVAGGAVAKRLVPVLVVGAVVVGVVVWLLSR
ncbi:MAG TPA: SRPBCC family protein [Acidimicrobiia bacterium]|nr:SRPBCC family protein [Acidimicrobiia bacterium]